MEMVEDNEVRITLRLTEALRDQLKEATEASGRSMNAEILTRLDLSFRFDQGLERFIDSHEELAKDHLELNKGYAALELENDKLNMELAATKAALAEQKTISASLQHLLREDFDEARKRQEQDAETMEAIESRFNSLKEQADYLESLRTELLNLSRERDAIRTEAEILVEEQSKVIERLSQDHKEASKVLATLQSVLRKAADGDDKDLSKIVASFSTTDGSDES